MESSVREEVASNSNLRILDYEGATNGGAIFVDSKKKKQKRDYLHKL